VSEPVARALAEGIRERTGASMGVGITGIAGPGPGTGADVGKPLGLVYIAVADAEGTQVREVRLTGDRERIRTFAALHGLEMIRRQLM
jgi:nicotinamide-nucleotide amidase